LHVSVRFKIRARPETMEVRVAAIGILVPSK
jgi:hypothetical protein